MHMQEKTSLTTTLASKDVDNIWSKSAEFAANKNKSSEQKIVSNVHVDTCNISCVLEDNIPNYIIQ